MRKFLVLAALLAVLLAGCAPPPQPQNSAVSFMVFGDPAELAAYQSLVQAFAAAQPGIDVELRHIPDQAEYLRRLAADFAAGAPPDVMLLNYRRVAAFAGEGGLQPVGPYLAQSSVIQEAGFYPQTLEAFRQDGQLWCMPQNASSLVVYYNRDLFDAAGIPYPSDDWTWDDFLTAAKALTRDLDGDGQVDQYGAGIDAELYRLAPFIWQQGGDLVDDPVQPSQLALDSPAAQAAFQWFVDLQTTAHVVPDAVAESAESSASRFLNGRLAMYFNSRRVVPTYRASAAFAWDVAPLPRSLQPASILHSDGYCLAAGSKDKAAAWKFIEFANSQKGQELMAATGRTVPSLRAVAESPAFLDPQQAPANSRVYIDAIPTLRHVPLMAAWPGIEDTASKEIERAFYGQASVEEAAAAAIELTRPFFER